jgi:hypothetical protein
MTFLRERRYRKVQCACGAWVTTNALGRAAHKRACPGKFQLAKPKESK